MVSTVGARPNHYEVLGLRPTASIDEIVRAFARKMSVAGVHPVTVAAAICSAYETLRDPDKRRVYDDALGLGPKPQSQPQQWRIGASQWGAIPLIAPAWEGPSAPPVRYVAPKEPDPPEEKRSARPVRDAAAPALQEPDPPEEEPSAEPVRDTAPPALQQPDPPEEEPLAQAVRDAPTLAPQEPGPPEEEPSTQLARDAAAPALQEPDAPEEEPSAQPLRDAAAPALQEPDAPEEEPSARPLRDAAPPALQEPVPPEEEPVARSARDAAPLARHEPDPPELEAVSSIAASLRALASAEGPPPRPPEPPTPLTPPEAEPSSQPPAAATPLTPPEAEPSSQPPAAATPLDPDDIEGRPISWKPTALIAGGLVAAVGLVGAWAGSIAGNDVESALPDNAVTLPLPRAKANPPAAAPAAAPSFLDTEPRQGARADYAARRTKRARPAPQRSLPEQGQAGQSQFVNNVIADAAPAASAVEQSAAAVPAAEPVAASMPLSNAAIARTIRKIGYSCGEVASTSAVEGNAGTYKVTCTSGQSYQAKQVRGRYRFRRLR